MDTTDRVVTASRRRPLGLEAKTTMDEAATKQKDGAGKKSTTAPGGPLPIAPPPLVAQQETNPLAAPAQIMTANSTLPQQETASVKRRKLEESPGLTKSGLPRKKPTPQRTLPPLLETLYQQWNDNARCTSLVQKEQQEAAYLLADAQRRLAAANQQATSLAQQKLVLEKQVLEAELALDNEFTQHYGQLVAFQREFGHANVHLSKLPEHKALAVWTKKMRRIKPLHQTGDHYQAPEWKYYLQALDRIGFIWDAVKDQWKMQFDKMLAFKAGAGHCCVPKAYPTDKSLGAWVHRQRYFYKLYHEGKPTQLTPERIELLNSVGFSWSGDSTTPVGVSVMPRPTKPRRGQGKKTPEQEWEHHFQLLLAFQARHGHVKISAVDDKARNNQLRDWAAWQRREYKQWKKGVQSHVTAEHVRRLAEIGFCWEVWPHKRTTHNADSNLGADSEPPGNVILCHPNANTAASTTAPLQGPPAVDRTACPPTANTAASTAAVRQGHPPVGRPAFVGARVPLPTPGYAAPV